MSKKPTPKEDKSRTLTVNNIEIPQERYIADIATGGLVNNAILITEFSKGNMGAIDLTECVAALVEKSGHIHKGDLKLLETILASQALALNTVFSSMAMRAKMNMGEYMDAAEKYMRLALKAQSQCRSTLQTLAEIKNPKPYIQHNQAQYQQVNNGTSAPTRGENSKMTNELLEDKTHVQEWLDTRAAQTSSGIDKELETVGL